MSRPGLILDSNLLLVWVVGTTAPQYLGTHKLVRAYSQWDFKLLHDIVSQARTIYLTPNTLTETSNFIRYFAPPLRDYLTAKFRELILVAEENYYATKGLVHRKEFQALGVTDVVLLEQMTSEHLFLTADFDLYAAARSKGVGVAINFNHYRDANPPE